MWISKKGGWLAPISQLGRKPTAIPTGVGGTSTQIQKIKLGENDYKRRREAVECLWLAKGCWLLGRKTNALFPFPPGKGMRRPPPQKQARRKKWVTVAIREMVKWIGVWVKRIRPFPSLDLNIAEQKYMQKIKIPTFNFGPPNKQK